MNYYYVVEGERRNNMGDVIQGMVAKAYLPKSAKPVDREALSEISSINPGFLLANGWYMHKFDKFPPPDHIKPLYISVHIAKSKMLAEKKVRDHFKKYSPVGCRDKKTLTLFLGWGIPAYYSGCLTINTKSRSSINNTNKGEILLVDGVDHPVPEKLKLKLENLIDEDLVCLSHDPPNKKISFDEYVKLSTEYMNNLLMRYCRASMVITTKIHCALPCLGMGVKVILIHPNPSSPRLYPVREYMDIFSFDDILNSDKLIIPKVNQKKIEARKYFFSKVITESKKNHTNSVKYPKLISLVAIKMKSNVMAFIYKLIVIISYKVGINKQQFEKVYGSMFQD